VAEVAELHRQQMKAGEGPVADAIRYGEARRIDDVKQEQRWRPACGAMSDLGYASCLVLPLRTDRKPGGALALYSRDADAFAGAGHDIALLFAAQGGLAGLFTHWPVYAVAVGGAAGVLLEQLALQDGPLRVSQPLLVITDPVVSVALSVWLFGEYFVLNGAGLAAAAAGFCVMCAGVVVMSLTAPATLQADADRAKAPRLRSG